MEFIQHFSIFNSSDDNISTGVCVQPTTHKGVLKEVISVHIWKSLHIVVENENCYSEVLASGSDKCEDDEITKLQLGKKYVACRFVHLMPYTA
jgi:hypothetical protein